MLLDLAFWLLFFWGYAPMQIPCGMLYDRLSARKILTITTFLSGLAALGFAYTDSFVLASLYRFIVLSFYRGFYDFICVRWHINCWCHVVPRTILRNVYRLSAIPRLHGRHHRHYTRCRHVERSWLAACKRVDCYYRVRVSSTYLVYRKRRT